MAYIVGNYRYYTRVAHVLEWLIRLFDAFDSEAPGYVEHVLAELKLDD